MTSVDIGWAGKVMNCHVSIHANHGGPKGLLWGLWHLLPLQTLFRLFFSRKKIERQRR